jgi:chloramphenicol O-acetyltransferase
MIWPLKRKAIPISETPTWSLYYLAACRTPADPTIIWGTDVPTAGLETYLKRVNADSDILVSAAHVLVMAVGRCLAKHPEFNRRVLHRRLFDFKQVNILLPVQGGKTGPEVCLFTDVDRKPLEQIAREVWRHSKELAKGESASQRDERIFRSIPGIFRGSLFRLMILGTNWINWPAALWGHRTMRSGTMINYLGQRGAPPMRMFKASRFPNDTATMNVTMGPTEDAVMDGPSAPLFVRVDHRVVDAYQLSQFVADLRQFLMEPELLEQATEAGEENAAAEGWPLDVEEEVLVGK